MFQKYYQKQLKKEINFSCEILVIISITLDADKTQEDTSLLLDRIMYYNID